MEATLMEEGSWHSNTNQSEHSLNRSRPMRDLHCPAGQLSLTPGQSGLIQLVTVSTKLPPAGRTVWIFALIGPAHTLLRSHWSRAS